MWRGCSMHLSGAHGSLLMWGAGRGQPTPTPSFPAALPTADDDDDDADAVAVLTGKSLQEVVADVRLVGTKRSRPPVCQPRLTFDLNSKKKITC